MDIINVEHPQETPTDCVRFDAQCGAFLERELEDSEQAWMTQHLASCATCRALVSDLEAIIADAQALPGIAPSRDLWRDIEARLDTQVIPIGIGTASAHSPTTRVKSFPVRTLAIAATLLVAVTSGVTWRIATSRNTTVDTTTPAASIASSGVPAAARTDSSDLADNTLNGEVVGITVASPSSSATPRASSGTAPRGTTRLVADTRDASNADAVYEREITALRTIVDERFAELDTTTVSELRRNLAIIDRAILDSKRALARDPRSSLLSTQLDRALETKLALLRRVALL